MPWPDAEKRKKGGLRFGVLLLFAAAVPIATFCFEMFTEFGHHPVWLGLYAAAIVIPLLLYAFLVRPQGWQGRYQDHRALAEGLRVQFFWSAAGLPTAVSDSYLRHQRGMLGWIRLALQGPALTGLAAGLGRKPDAAFLRERWMEDQVRYFRRQGDLEERAALQTQRSARVAVAGLLVIAGALTAAVFSNGGHYPHLEPGWLAEAPLVVLYQPP